MSQLSTPISIAQQTYYIAYIAPLFDPIWKIQVKPVAAVLVEEAYQMASSLRE